jgi:hypothetical protein
MKAPKDADELVIRWFTLTADTQRREIRLSRNHGWRSTSLGREFWGGAKERFRIRLNVLRKGWL